MGQACSLVNDMINSETSVFSSKWRNETVNGNQWLQ